MADIKIFVCCHKRDAVPKHPLLIPIQTGAALADTRFLGFLYDDVGTNISSKNPNYCELTAQYWAWKNIEADYYGFFHYRRYLYPDRRETQPYRVELRPTRAWLNRAGFAGFAELIQDYDLIMPKREDMHMSARAQYGAAPFHHQKDLETAERIVAERYPEYTAAMEKYLSEDLCYFCNMFIMRRQVFQRYCEWLFSVLEAFDREADRSGYSEQEQRVNGYLGERLLGIYATYLQQSGGYSLLELPKACFYPGIDGLYRKVINTVLPPGSRRRAVVKRCVRRLGVVGGYA